VTKDSGSTSKPNPKWSRDEIIVTLAFYFRHYPKIPDKRSIEVQELSVLLRSLNARLSHEVSQTYRNPNGVYMKLMNFHHFNDRHDGDGLKGGSKLDEEVFWQYADNLGELQKVAAAIQSWVGSSQSTDEVDLDEDFEVQEGRLLTRIHNAKERDRKIIQRKKGQVLRARGCLLCECCGFDFEKVYGELGNGFIECHHVKPVSEIVPGERTSLKDLALLCANCHRMIHRQRPWLNVDELKAKLIERQ